MVEISQIDINIEMFLSSSYLAMPREGNLESILHVMGNLKFEHKSHLISETTYFNIDYSNFLECDWTEF